MKLEEPIPQSTPLSDLPDRPASTSRRGNRFSRRPWLTTIGILVLGLCLFELLLRLVSIPILDFAHASRQVYHYHDRWYTDFRPGHSAQLTLPDRDGSNILDFEIVVDERGLRHAPGNDVDEPDATLVHAIGDSFTMGWGVDGEATYPARLDALLGPRFEVINLGVNGFGVIGATEKSREFAERFDARTPDLVIYVATENDYDDDGIALRHAQRPAWIRRLFDLGDGFRRTFRVGSLPFAGRWALRLAGLEAADVGDGPLPEEPIRTLDTEPLPGHQRDWGSPSKAALLRYVEGLPETTTMLVVTHGDGPMVRDLAAFSRSLALPVLRVVFDPRLIIPRDGHLTEEGNVRLAALIAGHVRSVLRAHAATSG